MVWLWGVRTQMVPSLLQLINSTTQMVGEAKQYKSTFIQLPVLNATFQCEQQAEAFLFV